MAPELQPTTRPRGATSSSSDSASLEKNDEVLTTSQTRDVGAIGDQEHAISSVENEKDVLEVAAAGHAATDSYGHALVHFDPVAEAKLRRKLDWHVVPMLSLIYLMCFIDRANIGNARISTFEKDLGLQGLQYNHLLSIFYIAYAVTEIPMTVLCKIVGPGKFIPGAATVFGIATLCFAFVHSFATAIPVRIILGIAEASVFPGIAFAMSRFYRKDELAFRLSLYVVCAPVAGAVGSLLASGILTSESMGSVVRWRQIFLIEGMISIIIGIVGFWFCPESIEKAKWLTEEEKALALARVKSENVATTEVVEGLEIKPLFKAMTSFTTVAIAVIFLLDNIAAQSLGFFSPTVVRQLFPGRTTVQIQLLTVPPYVVGAISTLLLPWLSGRFKTRGPIFVFASLFMITGYAIFVNGNNSNNAKYAGLFLAMIGTFPLGALCNAWACANVTTDSARNGAIALVVFFGNLGGVCSTWTFTPSDSPKYIKANTAVMSFSVAIFALSVAMILYIRRQNNRRDSGKYQLDMSAMSQEEISRLGQRHPGFRFRT